MKHKILVGLIAALATTGAFAQTTVTLYGSIDISVNYTTNQNAKGDSVLSLGDSNAGTGAGDGGQGAIGGSRWGLKGEEDLGGGSKAIFQAESGFTANNGVSDQQGQLFGRQVFVGLTNTDLGQLTFGRQYGIMTEMAFDFDPLGVGNYVANEWEVFMYGVRFDNSIFYHKTWGPVTLGVQYAPGGVAGDTTQGTTAGFDLKYVEGPLALGGAYQQSADQHDNKATFGNLDMTYNFGPATLFLNYYNLKYDNGFAKGSNSGTGTLGNTSMFGGNGIGGARTDNLWVVGLGYNFTPATALTLGYMHDGTSQDNIGSGKMASAYALLEYHFTKRTEVYLTVDNSTVSGTQATSAASGSGSVNGVGAGQTSSSAVAAGMRFKF